MIRVTALCIAAMILAGCVTDPTVYAVERSRQYPDDKSVIWGRMLRYLETNRIAVMAIEKESGVITAHREFHGAETSWGDRGHLSNVADCGKDFMAIPEGHTLKISALVIDDGARRSTASVIVTILENHIDASGWGANPPPPRECNSTGVLERDILNSLAEG